MSFSIKSFQELTTTELYDILALRQETFALEQQVPYMDTDYKDLEAIHVFQYDHQTLVSCCRILKMGLSYPDAVSIGRVCVSKRFRGQKKGIQLIKEALNYLKTNPLGTHVVKISAQYYLVPFYSQFGFEVDGLLYDEDGLPHKKMKLVL